MDDRQSKRISIIISLIFICVAFMLFEGCQKKPYQMFASDKGKFIFTCEIPSQWEITDRDFLSMRSPKSIEGVPASIFISERYISLKDVIKFAENNIKRSSKEYPDYKPKPISHIKVGKFKAITYSIISEYDLDASASRHKYLSRPLLKPVLRKETWIYIDDPEINYDIRYAAPVAICDRNTNQTTPVRMYDEYLPVLAHLIGTFEKIEEGSPQALKFARYRKIYEILPRFIHFLIIVFFAWFFWWSIKLRKRGIKVFHWLILIPFLNFSWIFIRDWSDPPDIVFVTVSFVFWGLIPIITWLISLFVYKQRLRVKLLVYLPLIFLSFLSIWLAYFK